MTIKILGKRTGLGNCIQFIPHIEYLKEVYLNVYSDNKIYADLGVCDYSERPCEFNIAVYGYDWKKYLKEIGNGALIGYKYRILGKEYGFGLRRSISFNDNISEIKNNDNLIRESFGVRQGFVYPDRKRRPIKNRIIIGFSSKEQKYIKSFISWKLYTRLQELGFEVWFVDHNPGFRFKETKTIKDLVSILETAQYYIGADTGVSHLADYLGIPHIKIFGATSIIKNAGRATTISRGLDCQPCYDHGRVSCSHYSCNQIDEKLIISKVKELWY